MIKVNGNDVQFEQFPNGETKLVHESIKVYSFNRILFKYVDDSDLIKLLFVKNYLDRISKRLEVELTIAYMPYSRMDRSENGSPFTLKFVANFINSLKFTRVIVIEPHSDVTAALLDNVEAHFINFNLIEQVKKLVSFDDKRDSIMFPDVGAAKRYSKMNAQNILIGNKKRDFETGRIDSLELTGDLDAVGNKVIIVDDLSSYGGTFVKSAEALKKEGFEHIFLLVAHAENSIFKGKLFDHMEMVFTTDSMLTEQNHWNHAKFKPQLHIFELEELIK